MNRFTLVQKIDFAINWMHQTMQL